MGVEVAAIGSWKSQAGARMRKPRREAEPGTEPRDLEQADDRALVGIFLAGRREAFDEIVRRHQRQIYMLCYRFVANHEEAADLTQDVFVRAFKGVRGFKGNASLSTWLYRVGVNVCLNRVTPKRPVVEGLDGLQPADERAETPFERVARSERSAVLRRAIAHLPRKQRAVVILRVYQDLPHEEIARILGSSVGAVKANFFHAVGNLRRELGET